MSLAIGTKLGPYEIIAALGAGGMGEVYRARDTRIDRIVAIKVLPSHLASNPDLRQRFDREARAISSLNHPNICALYDIGQQDGIDFLVMEFLEGDSLAVVLEKGAIPTQELLRVAIQIADALDKAHRQGLVHRDLKPANIVLTKNGAKLLDFGLAKWSGTNTVSGLSGVTRTVSPLTTEGAIVGTFQYMSPEQLEGGEADSRSDLFSFGVILYEMATGTRPFSGKSQASLIASIMKEEPRPISAIQPLTPPALERVVKQCLAKEPDDRWQTAGDLKRELSWIVEGGSQIGVPTQVAVRRKRKLQASWLVAAIATLAALSLLAYELFQPKEEKPTTRFTIATPPGLRSIRWPIISPDGKTLAFQGIDSSGRMQVWVRPLNSLTAVPLPGTDNVRPFWSFDSKYLAFVETGQLKKVAATGGPVQLIAQTPGGSDGTWGSNNIVLYDGDADDSIRQVSTTGGTPTGATSVNRAAGERYHAWPEFLPDNEHFLFLASVDTIGDPRSIAYVVNIGSLKSSEVKPLFASNSLVRYDYSGYLLYVVGDILMARPFDANKLEVTGEPTPIGQHVTTSNGLANFSLSRNGILIYQSSSGQDNSQLRWVDREGRLIDSIGVPAPTRDIAISPDGKRLAYTLNDPSTNTDDIWVRDLTRGVASRLTFDLSNEIWPVWSPDGSRIFYASNRQGTFSVMSKLANGLGQDELVYADSVGVNIGPQSVSQDGRYMTIDLLRDAQWDISLYEFETKKIRPILTSTFNEFCGVLSPDGRFLAYQSDETGTYEVYVVELSGAGGKWQISSDFGSTPTWSDNGKELLYQARPQSIYAIPITAGATLEAGTPKKLFEMSLQVHGLRGRRFAISPDGTKFLLNSQLNTTVQPSFVVVLNWQEELNQK